MTQPSAESLVLFATVVEAGSFSAASRTLGVTRQSVSERIAKLEAELGVRLLERTTRSLRATDAGAVLHEHARDIRRLLQEATAEVTGMQAEPTGLLRVTVPGAFGRIHMPAIASELLETHSGLRMEVHLTDRFVSLVEEGYDAAVRIGELDDSTLLCRKVGEERLVFVASPVYLERRGVPVPDTLGEHTTVGLAAHEQWHLGAARHTVEPRLVLTDLQAVCAATVAGVGVSRLPTFAVAAAVRRGELRVLFADEPSSVRRLWVVYPSRRHLAPKVRCFIEAVEAHARGAFGVELESV